MQATLYMNALPERLTSNRHSVVATIDYNLRSRKKPTRIITRHQEGRTHEFAGLTESLHRGMTDDRSDALGERILRFCSAGKKPGTSVLTRTPFGAHSRARFFERLCTAAFVAE